MSKRYHLIPRSSLGWLTLLFVLETACGLGAVVWLGIDHYARPSAPSALPQRPALPRSHLAAHETPPLAGDHAPSPAIPRSHSQIASLIAQVQAQSLDPEALARAAMAMESSDFDALELFSLEGVDIAVLGALGGALLLRQQPPRPDLLDHLETQVLPTLIADSQADRRLSARRRSLQAMGWIPCAVARGHLFEILRQHPGSWEGRLAAEGLARIADDDLRSRLSALLPGAAPELRLRLQPLLSLGTAPPPTTPSDRQAFLRSVQPERLRPLATALARSDPDFLRAQMSQGQRPAQALAAGWALWEMGEFAPEGLLTLAETTARAAGDPALRRLAIAVLGALRESARGALLDLARTAVSPADRALALGWLLRTASAVELSSELTEILRRDPDGRVRQRAQRGYATIKTAARLP